MSHNNPIPTLLRDDFRAHMQRSDRRGVSNATRIFDLEDAAIVFVHHHGLRYANPAKAVGQYLRMVDPLTTQKDLPRIAQAA